MRPTALGRSSEPFLIGAALTVACECGSTMEFPEVAGGAQHIRRCRNCARAVSVQMDDPIVQTVHLEAP